jgi:hypothetical protein
MKIKAFPERVSRTTQKVLSVLLQTTGQEDARPIREGLPAGAVHLKDRNLIFAGTSCDPPLFLKEARLAAVRNNADVVLCHHGLFPEALNPVSLTVFVRINGVCQRLKNLLLYFHPADGYWLIPAKMGIYVAIEPDGLRVAHDPPFLTWHQRSEGLCNAARLIKCATRQIWGQ